MMPNDRKNQSGQQGDLYDADADQPEVRHEANPLPNHNPSQAEGDRQTVEEDIDEKEDELESRKEARDR